MIPLHTNSQAWYPIASCMTKPVRAVTGLPYHSFYHSTFNLSLLSQPHHFRLVNQRLIFWLHRVPSERTTLQGSSTLTPPIRGLGRLNLLWTACTALYMYTHACMRPCKSYNLWQIDQFIKVIHAPPITTKSAPATPTPSQSLGRSTEPLPLHLYHSDMVLANSYNRFHILQNQNSPTTDLDCSQAAIPQTYLHTLVVSERVYYYNKLN